jgi:hypothetical protein
MPLVEREDFIRKMLSSTMPDILKPEEIEYVVQGYLGLVEAKIWIDT